MDPDVSLLSSIPSLLVSRFKKIMFILDVRSTPVEAVGFRGFLTKFWFSASILVAKKLFHGITIITPLMRKEVCDNYDINPNKVGVWTTGVSANLFDPKNRISQGKELRRSLGLSGNFVVFYHGVFTSTRGLTETIKAVRILKRKYPKIVFFLLGTGPMLPMMKELIHADRLEENVVIHDRVAQMEVPKFIQMCDVCIVPLPYHPYWRFQCPVKLLEYLAMKKVIIATDIPAHRAITGEEKCVIYISSIKPTDIARSIEYAYNNKEKLEEWGKCGRAVIIEKYTLEKVAKDLSDYLLSIDDKF
jgi:glycosyltransferase involved in cell wall biosynthesis